MSLIQIIKHIIQIFKPERATGQMSSSPNLNGHEPTGSSPNGHEPTGSSSNGHELNEIFDIHKFIVKKT